MRVRVTAWMATRWRVVSVWYGPQGEAPGVVLKWREAGYLVHVDAGGEPVARCDGRVTVSPGA